jgi:NitT/TauT family transport system substrate-binding protein
MVGTWVLALAVDGVLAAADSGITSAAHFSGERVVVNTLSGMGGLTIREAVGRDGGDPDGNRFVEVPFPDMPAALTRGPSDAVKASVSEFLGLPAEFLGRVRVEEFGTGPRRDQVERPGEPTVEDGLLEKDADVDGLLPQA